MIKTTVNIEGMMCPMCEKHMNDAVKNNFDIKDVKSSHERNRTEILSEGHIEESRLSKIVADTGYEYKGMKEETV